MRMGGGTGVEIPNLAVVIGIDGSSLDTSALSAEQVEKEPYPRNPKRGAEYSLVWNLKLDPAFPGSAERISTAYQHLSLKTSITRDSNSGGIYGEQETHFLYGNTEGRRHRNFGLLTGNMPFELVCMFIEHFAVWRKLKELVRKNKQIPTNFLNEYRFHSS